MQQSMFRDYKMAQDMSNLNLLDNRNLPGNLRIDGSDYMVDEGLGELMRDHRGHAQDGGYASELQGKLPNHPTFSNESPYASADRPGGEWVNGNLGGRNQIHPDRFTPSLQMVQDGRAAGLGSYFKRNEPGNQLTVPAPYDVNSSYFQRDIRR